MTRPETTGEEWHTLPGQLVPLTPVDRIVWPWTYEETIRFYKQRSDPPGTRWVAENHRVTPRNYRGDRYDVHLLIHKPDGETP